MNILITGVTGFVGQGLLHLLTSDDDEVRPHLPAVGLIYVAIRAKRHETATQRFERLCQTFPKLTLRLVSTPIAQLGDEATGLDDVQCVINLAASVDFHLEIRESLRQNVDGLLSLLQFARNRPSVTRFIHISTAYVTSDAVRSPIREECVDLGRLDADVQVIYDQIQSGNWDFESIQRRHYFANTYTLTKCLAERMVERESRNNERTHFSIIRPSIITPATKVPFAGWYQGNAATIGYKTMILLGYANFGGDINIEANEVPVDRVCAEILDVLGQIVQGPTRGGRVQVCHATSDCNVTQNKEPVVLLRAPYYTAAPTLRARGLSFVIWLRILVQYASCAFLSRFFSSRYAPSTRRLAALLGMVGQIGPMFLPFTSQTFRFERTNAAKDSALVRVCTAKSPIEHARQMMFAILTKIGHLHRIDALRRSIGLLVLRGIWYMKKNTGGWWMLWSRLVLARLFRGVIVDMDDQIATSLSLRLKPILLMNGRCSDKETAVLVRYVIETQHIDAPMMVVASDYYRGVVGDTHPAVQRLFQQCSVKYVDPTREDDLPDVRDFFARAVSQTSLVFLLFPACEADVESRVYSLLHQTVDFNILPMAIAISEPSRYKSSDDDVTGPNRCTGRIGWCKALVSLRAFVPRARRPLCYAQFGRVFTAPACHREATTMVVETAPQSLQACVEHGTGAPYP